MLNLRRNEGELIRFHGRIGERIKEVREIRMRSKKESGFRKASFRASRQRNADVPSALVSFFVKK